LDSGEKRKANELYYNLENVGRAHLIQKEIRDTIKSPDFIERTGRRVRIHKTFLNRFSGYPLKVVYEEREEVFVITLYPLKKAYRRHGHEG
jgi:hypothetical protein